MGRPWANLKKPSQFGLLSATREHEGGIASNPGSACRGEYVPGPCTPRPSHHGSWLYPKAVRKPAREPADGSPPFWNSGARCQEADVRNGGCGTDPDLPQAQVRLPGTWFLAPDA